MLIRSALHSSVPAKEIRGFHRLYRKVDEKSMHIIFRSKSKYKVHLHNHLFSPGRKSMASPPPFKNKNKKKLFLFYIFYLKIKIFAVDVHHRRHCTNRRLRAYTPQNSMIGFGAIAPRRRRSTFTYYI
jgi:hypothetical protein